MKILAFILVAELYIFGTFALGQGVLRSAATVELTSDSVKVGQVVHATATMVPFTVEGDTAGQNAFDIVTTDPLVIVSLVLPSGTEITGSNAASLGFTINVVSDASLGTAEVPSIFSLPGTHTFIQIPGGQPSGTFQVKANAASSSTDSAMLAMYFASSTVGATATTDSANYAVGHQVILSGLVFDGGNPITGATVTAAVSAPTSLAGQATIGNFQLVSQQAISSSLTDYTYSASITNTGGALTSALAEVATTPANVTLLGQTLGFGAVAANSTVSSANTFVIEHDPNQSFDPATLQWNITTPGAATNVTLLDSGPFDAATGDGIYTGTLTPASAGDYTALITIAGTSRAGNSFSRTVTTQFTVTPSLASLASFSDAQQTGGIVVTANVNVQTAGTYRFNLQLQASNGQIATQATKATLATGSQQVSVTFSNSQMFALGVSGPYERINALLVNMDTSASGSLIADSILDAGPTAAYTLSSFAPPLYFNGQNSAAGVVTGAGPTFDLLRITIGVSNTTAGTCDWAASLTDLAGNKIAFTSVMGSVASGSTSVTLDFDGNLIAQSVNGPYLIKDAAMHCANGTATALTLFQTQSFTTSQFTFVTPDFNVAVRLTPPAAVPGSTFSFGIIDTVVGAFGGSVNLSVSGLPSGASGSFAIPTVVGLGESTLIVTTTAGTPPGTYALTVTGTSGSRSHTVNATLTINGPNAAILQTITVAAPMTSVITGTVEQLTATGHYSDSSTADLTNSASWMSSATGVATVSSTGLLTATGAGSTTITATSAGISGTVGITSAAPVYLLRATPAPITKDGSGNFIVQLTFVNQGNVTLTNIGLTLAKLNSTSIAAPSPIASLAPGASQIVTLTFPPTSGASPSNGALSTAGSCTGIIPGGPSQHVSLTANFRIALP